MVILDCCLFDVPSNAVWSLLVLMLVYPVPLFTIISIYIHIIAVIIHQLNFLKKHGSGEIRIKSKQTKMIRSAGSIFAAYLICWAPTFCVLMAVSWALLLGIDLHLSNYVMMFYFVEVLSYANSLVNPCIYFLSSRSFQRAARIMFHLQDTLASTRTVTGTITEQIDSGRDYINDTDKITKFWIWITEFERSYQTVRSLQYLYQTESVSGVRLRFYFKRIQKNSIPSVSRKVWLTYLF